MKRVSNEEILTAYATTGSIWKAAKLVGLCGQSVHERLLTLGATMGNRRWTQDEDTEVAALIEAGVTVGQIASRLGRTFAAVACRMNERGLVVKAHSRKRKLPRASGYDKQSVLKAMKVLESTDVPVTRYARANGLNIDSLIYAFGNFCPERWQAFAAKTSPYPTAKCPTCGRDYVPMTKRQTTCSRQCTNAARMDRTYFGGNRNLTIGLAEGVCQLCARNVAKGLSSHHVLGKENDPENTMLVALCQGCHKLVGLLATRAFLDDESAWETLISLAIMRRDGPKIASGEMDKQALSTCVEARWEACDDD